jgi:ABC-2 type transport system permease protein
MKLHRILALLRKEFGQVVKDKKMLPIIFVVPVLQLILLGFAASLDVKDIVLVVCDLDKSVQSRQLLEQFTNSGYFTIEENTNRYGDVQQFLDNYKASAAIVIPTDFGKRLLRKEPAKIQMLLDGSAGSTAAITMSYASQIVTGFSSRVLIEQMGSVKVKGGISAEVRAWFNAALKHRNFMVPGVLVLILLMTTTNLTAMAIVKEKEIGTLEQIMVTPIRPSELILGKLVPFVIIGFVNVSLVLLVMVLGFGIPVKGSMVLLFVLTGFFLLTSLGIGLFVSTISRTQQQAMMMAMLGILMPMMYLSGFVFPINNMPPLLQFVSLGIPMRYYLVIARSVILKGVGLETLWPEATVLLIMGGLILFASVRRFRKKLD